MSQRSREPVQVRNVPLRGHVGQRRRQELVAPRVVLFEFGQSVDADQDVATGRCRATIVGVEVDVVVLDGELVLHELAAVVVQL